MHTHIWSCVCSFRYIYVYMYTLLPNVTSVTKPNLWLLQCFSCDIQRYVYRLHVLVDSTTEWKNLLVLHQMYYFICVRFTPFEFVRWTRPSIREYSLFFYENFLFSVHERARKEVVDEVGSRKRREKRFVMSINLWTWIYNELSFDFEPMCTVKWIDIANNLINLIL